MRSFLRFFAIFAFLLFAGLAQAQNVAVPPDNADGPIIAPTLKCALDEYPSEENGTESCKKVPSCKAKGEIISYDEVQKKFVCKTLIHCGCANTNVPCTEKKRREQPAYINGKNVCLDVPDCEKTGQGIVFDGKEYSCR